MSVDTMNTLQLVVAAIVAIGVVAGGFWALARLVVAQFEKRLDERFQAQAEDRAEGRQLYEERFVKLEADHHTLDRAHMKLLADLPREYVRREDHIRFETVINAKLDALYSEMRLFAERAQIRQPRS